MSKTPTYSYLEVKRITEGKIDMTVAPLASFDPVTRANIEAWLHGHYDQDTKKKLLEMLEKQPQEVRDAFYTSLAFGTGGLRGVMGLGTNRMNRYTVGAATQGIANYLLQQPLPGDHKHAVFISYDSRLHSKEFALHAACVLAGNGIRVFLTKELRPTPLVSFGCRHLHCSAAIMITASHNPPEYNGYKVYWKDGAQILPPHDTGIIEEVRKIADVDQVKTCSLPSPLIQEVGEEIDQAYFEAIAPLQLYPVENQAHGHFLRIVYTSLHGAGITMVPKALAGWGFTNVDCVQEQCRPDGTFPTVHSPNPEERAALLLGIEQLLAKEADILLATDPDTDRMGVAVRHQGKEVILNGNQIACLCLYHICEALKKKKAFPLRAGFIKSIVTTELFCKIAESYGGACFDVLTGFKYIGEKIRQWEEDTEKYQYIFGGEESYGYLLGTHARDKDAVVASCLFAEVALQAKRDGKTVVDILNLIYERFGIFREKLVSITLKGKEGVDKMRALMESLRAHPPKKIGKSAVRTVADYACGLRRELATGKTEKIALPHSDVLIFWLEDGSKVAIRPSGTEPKIKVYAEVAAPPPDKASLESAIMAADARLEDLVSNLMALLR